MFEESKLPLRKWFIALWMLMDNPKGVAARRLASQIGVTHKTAWFLLHRLRTAAAQVDMGGFDETAPVEADETYIGGRFDRMHAKQRRRWRERGGYHNKHLAIGFRSRADSNIRLETLPDRTTDTMSEIAHRHMTVSTPLFSDGALQYRKMGFEHHHFVDHGKGEYVDGHVHTNGIESVWATLKRSYKGVYHYMSGKHLHRYLAELECRWNMKHMTSGERLDRMLAASAGVRLTLNDLTNGE